MVVNQIIIVHEPIAERRVHHKLREKTIFNSKSVQWRHQKGLRFHHRVVKLHIEYFFMTFQWLKKSGQNVSRKDGFCLWDANKYNKLLDNHLYSKTVRVKVFLPSVNSVLAERKQSRLLSDCCFIDEYEASRYTAALIP